MFSRYTPHPFPFQTKVRTQLFQNHCHSKHSEFPKKPPTHHPYQFNKTSYFKAHSNGTNIHPNTTLHKILNQSNIFSNFEKQREIIGSAKGSLLKYSNIWTSIDNSCPTTTQT